jgi:hypothetical protein
VRLVVQSRTRPGFHTWSDFPLTRALRDTLQESWDSEPDARLTSVCILERLQDMRSNMRKLLPSNRSGSGVVAKKPLEVKQSRVITFDEPWTGRNVCLERNLLRGNAAAESSTGGELSNRTDDTEHTATTNTTDLEHSSNEQQQSQPQPQPQPQTKRNNLTLIQNRF